MLSYNDIVQNILYYYPVYCRAKVATNKRQGFSWVPGELEVGYALNQIEGSLDHPAERLMLHTAGLILSAGREPEVARNANLGDILGLIEKYGVNALLGDLSEADARRVKADLELFGVI
ncbi:hypothetical protein [Pseudomonas fluorescens]|uniref:hypothetical protein n=1 Tax=Pseudomonas fluorescens TaxID=294 RepID=UPI0011166DC5|nr:hypothetical protein [Pseudomonas fluorescens]